MRKLALWGVIVESGIVIWVDLQTSPATVDLCAQVSFFSAIFKVRGVDKVADAIRALTPCAVLFEYDDPSEELLEPLESLASEFPGARFVMITQEHSESLAIWALRARLWDYLVKPVDLLYLLSRVDLHREPGTASVKEYKRRRVQQDMTPNRGNGGTLVAGPRLVNESKAVRLQNLLTPALSFVNANYAEKVTLGVVAKLCGLGRYQFSRAFKHAHGTTFRKFLIIHRIRKAEQMLCSTNLSITEVAFSVGFNDLSHFAKMFRRHTGARPSEYLERKRKETRMHLSHPLPVKTENGAKLL
ncbi:AraC family transcriptional regulator [Telmatobacter sp. DSM 110680]|uniref:AraC family transcriptional regulator n=1 Tax=Telmatobacter sp. DSM 110680 TaxID=3036704 RepID=A0AAU7DDE2_9BACT